MNGRWIICATVTLMLAAVSAQAEYKTVYGGPTYDASTETGYRNPDIEIFPGRGVNDSGTAVGSADKYESGNYKRERAIVWSSSGWCELANLGTDDTGNTLSRPYAINAGGTIAGYALKYDDPHNYKGSRAVRWAAGGTTATELGHIGTDTSGKKYAYGYDINTGGTIVGRAYTYDGDTQTGYRAVRWASGETDATELGHIGTNNYGTTEAYPYAINDSGIAVGYAKEYSGNTSLGLRAVRWDADTTEATELGNLETDSSGATIANAKAINASGTIVGQSEKYDGDTCVGKRAVRWDAGGTTVTELGNLGVNNSGYTYASAQDINDSGVVAGYSNKYDSSGNYLGRRAVYWPCDGTVPMELDNLSADDSGYAESYAEDINFYGVSVGYAMKYDDVGNYIGYRAVCWGDDGAVVDLNTLIDPSSGWVLEYARAISDTEWVSGIGEYDPDGAGSADAYDRLFVMQIPEPATMALLSLGGLALIRRRRRNHVAFLMLLALVMFLPSAALAVDIETVHVGNTANSPDTEVMTTDGTTGYGAVDYEYNIGKYEITAGQYTEFLNAVASTDTYGLYN